MSSVDGRIQAQRWGHVRARKLFEKTAEKIEVDAWLVGRTTMEEFSSKKPRRKRKGTFRIPRTDFVAVQKRKTFAVAIDPSGKCNWTTDHVDTEHVIEVLTEKVPSEYLDHLRRANVSYVFAGKSELDLRRALEKLRELFGIERVRIDGGGTVNGSFLEAGLIDEFSHVVVPVADGSVGTPTSFDTSVDPAKRRATHLKLESVKQIGKDALWVRYKVRAPGSKK
jgi:riboflavin biosynthesis pyrimidine reductase